MRSITKKLTILQFPQKTTHNPAFMEHRPHLEMCCEVVMGIYHDGHNDDGHKP